MGGATTCLRARHSAATTRRPPSPLGRTPYDPKTPRHLRGCTSAREWGHGHIVVDASYDTPGVVEQYFDLVPALEDLYVDADRLLSPHPGCAHLACLASDAWPRPRTRSWTGTHPPCATAPFPLSAPHHPDRACLHSAEGELLDTGMDDTEPAIVGDLLDRDREHLGVETAQAPRHVPTRSAATSPLSRRSASWGNACAYE